MRILHTSDWHLGKHLNEFNRADEQEAVMKEITEIADNEDVDIVVIAGDLFDTYSPSSDSQRLFYQTTFNLAKGNTRPVIAIAGNHDSPDRIESPDILASISGIFLFGYPASQPQISMNSNTFNIVNHEPGFMEIQFQDNRPSLRIIFTPFTNEERMKIFLGETQKKEEVYLRMQLQTLWQALADKYCDNKGVNIMAAHQFFIDNENDISVEEPEDENAINVGGTSAIYSADIPKQIQYVALGHLHSCHPVGHDNNNKLWYSGSPLGYSFAETEQDKFVIIADIEPDKPANIRKVKLENGCKLVRKAFDNIAEATKWLSENQDKWVELTIISDTFLSGNDKKMLYDASDKIVTIIPQVKTETEQTNRSESISSLRNDKDAMFKSYFKSVNNQDPDEKLINLFHEILSKQL